jgi:hypothetical protein
MAEGFFSDELRFRCTPELALIVRQAARQDGLKPSEFMRQGIVAMVKEKGFALSPSKSAGELYDVMEGKQRWALVTPAGAVLFMGYADKPESDPAERGVWLPIVHEDSQPLDPALHWRLAPTARIETDRVVVTYPVVEKSLEIA